MNIVFLQDACGSVIEGPTCRVPFGNYKIEKSGDFKECHMVIDKENILEVNSKIILSNNSSIKMLARGAENLTVRFIRET